MGKIGQFSGLIVLVAFWAMLLIVTWRDGRNAGRD